MPKTTSSLEPIEAVEAPAADASADVTAALIQGWVAGHLLGGPIAQNTECWNALQAALPSLISIIKEG